MDRIEKVRKVKIQLPTGANVSDNTIAEYLDFAKSEILGYMHGGKTPANATEVPSQYEAVQIEAVVIGLGLIGGVGEVSHSESGISRGFAYSDMVSFIRSKVFPRLKVQ